ncbi:GDP-mannose 4,6-dehydratase [Polynucleobacter necessarius]|uniref:GDP-mannose 4,6-dehydratase n=1 Tax=Polynucleobacter necessarius TaxID=576610 RepID=UPI000E09A41E|nr:GDP-mannose 4,6-dehydratase [Polynucleobacter necessarius]HAT39072.1 hypothetical protein [Polynucleobacter sp.]
MRRACIIGNSGQDGTLLSKLLSLQEYKVDGTKSNDLDILDPKKVIEYLNDINPNEVYYLAAYHHSSASLPQNTTELFHKSMDIHFHAPVNFLDAIIKSNRPIKFFYASSSHIFGSSGDAMHTENTPYAPLSEYSISKTAGMRACQHFRANKNVFASTAILYNHESPLRKHSFISKKIASTVAKIYTSKLGLLEIADLDAEVDWGDARDYVEAMHQILQLDKADDFIVSTGKLHSVRDFVEAAFNYVGLNYLDFVVTKKNDGFRESIRRLGDFSKLKNETGWQPSIDFKTMVENMVQHEINLINQNS